MILGISRKDWSKYQSKEIAEIAKDILESELLGDVGPKRWQFAIDSDNRLRAYNNFLNVSTEPFFIHNPVLLADEVYYRMLQLDNILPLFWFDV